MSLDQIEAAIGRPYYGYYKPLWKKCGALVQSMASNHGFADGNKRTTLALVLTLIDNSGYLIAPYGDEDIVQSIEDLIVSAARHETKVETVMEWFRLRLRPAVD